MAAQVRGISFPPAMMARLVAEAEATGLKVSTIVQQSLKARWNAQDVKAA